MGAGSQQEPRPRLPLGRDGHQLLHHRHLDPEVPAVQDDGQSRHPRREPAHGRDLVGRYLLELGSDHGTQFGAEAAFSGSDAVSATATQPGYDNPGYWKYYYYIVRDTKHDRELLVQGLGDYIDDYGTSANSSNAWYKMPQGRSATSVAMSADGIWCATAMPGGNEQRICLWRTDGMAIPDDILNQTYVIGIDGMDTEGNTLDDTSCIINLGGESASGTFINSNQRFLFPDSLMFVDGGLLFLNEGQLDRVFGISLSDGTLSSRSLLPAVRSAVNAAGTGPLPPAMAARGQFPPDQDYLRGTNGSQGFGAQFAFKGNLPAPGSTGPDKVAFVAGDNRDWLVMTDLGTQPRDGYMVIANRNKSLLFMDVGTAGGFDLAAATVQDLTGNDPEVYGDLLTPGRFGEEMDWLEVSPDGRFVAVVRDQTEGVANDYTVSTFGYRSTFHSGVSSGTNWQGNDDVLLISAEGVDMDTGTGGTQHVLYIGSASFTNNTSTAPPGMPVWATGRAYLNAAYRRVNGLTFSADNKTLIFNYSGGPTYTPKYTGGNNSWAVNPTTTGTFGFGTQVNVQLDFRTAADGAINFASVGTSMSNALTGLTGIGAIGPTGQPFGDTVSSGQMFWARFKSPNGNFLYWISDELTSSNHMVGMRITSLPVVGSTRAAFVPFRPTPTGVGFEQFDANSLGYENRFAASPGGIVYPPSGRDASGVLCFIASASAAGVTSATDLEVYVMDVNVGGDARVVTAAVTDGTANAINHLYMSADGNFLVGQRTKSASNSRDSRAAINGDNDIFAVTNLHAVIAVDAVPTAFIISAGMSHGSTMAFVGEGTATGPQALVYSVATKGGNTTWDDRTLKIGLLAEGVPPSTLDSTQSHYVVLAAAASSTTTN
ncbi:MAG: hypothetical protein HC813_00030 [Planctomycetes bacterium]|nr:hypothetical protein [Planctomycetota bacterium]